MAKDNTTDSSTNKWFVHFDPNTKKVLKVSSRDTPPLNGREVLITENEICKELTTGKLSKRDLAVYQDLDDQSWFLDTKGSTLILNGKDHWVKLEPGSRGESEVHIDIFTETNTLEVSVNLKVIKDNFRLKEINEIAKNRDNILDLYITRQGDPDFMITTLEIDALTLFTTGKQSFQLNIDSYADIKDISIYTRQVFENYSYNYKKIKFETDFNNKRSRLLQLATKDEVGDITLMPTKGEVKVTSSLTNYEKYVTDQKKFLHFLVCSSNIDNIVGGFEVPYKRIVGKKVPYYAGLSFEWPEDPLVVYRNKYVKIGIIEQEEEK